MACLSTSTSRDYVVPPVVAGRVYCITLGSIGESPPGLSMEIFIRLVVLRLYVLCQSTISFGNSPQYISAKYHQVAQCQRPQDKEHCVQERSLRGGLLLSVQPLVIFVRCYRRFGRAGRMPELLRCPLPTLAEPQYYIRPMISLTSTRQVRHLNMMSSLEIGSSLHCRRVPGRHVSGEDFSIRGAISVSSSCYFTSFAKKRV